MIRVGTCGFQYRDWAPAFYPGTLDRALWLQYYSERFSCCELAFTSYRMPEPDAIGQLIEGSRGRLQFVLRVPTVLVQQEPQEEIAKRFSGAVWPLRDAGQLAGVLARFGAPFVFNRENFARLRLIRKLLSRLPLIAEFASAGWLHPSAIRHLAAEQIALACLEGSGSFRFTACPAYVRFDGRNQSSWLAGDGSRRHDYMYAQSELESALCAVRELESQGGNTLVVMNNPWRGQAAVNAMTMMELVQDGCSR